MKRVTVYRNDNYGFNLRCDEMKIASQYWYFYAPTILYRYFYGRWRSSGVRSYSRLTHYVWIDWTRQNEPYHWMTNQDDALRIFTTLLVHGSNVLDTCSDELWEQKTTRWKFSQDLRWPRRLVIWRESVSYPPATALRRLHLTTLDIKLDRLQLKSDLWKYLSIEYKPLLCL